MYRWWLDLYQHNIDSTHEDALFYSVLLHSHSRELVWRRLQGLHALMVSGRLEMGFPMMLRHCLMHIV